MTDINREAIAAKIRALQAKTIANGATEAEAMAAVFMAQKLIDKYQITMTEHEVKQEGFVHCEFNSHENYENWFSHGVCNALCELTNTKALYFGRSVIRFYGYQSDIDFVKWVYPNLERFVLSNAAAFSTKARAQGAPETHYILRKPFIFGACARISQRIRAEVAERNKEHIKESQSRALVIVDRKALVEAEVKKMYPKLGKGSSRRLGKNPAGSFQAGTEAGNKASWNRPIQSGAKQQSIGSKQ